MFINNISLQYYISSIFIDITMLRKFISSLIVLLLASSVFNYVFAQTYTATHIRINRKEYIIVDSAAMWVYMQNVIGMYVMPTGSYSTMYAAQEQHYFFSLEKGKDLYRLNKRNMKKVFYDDKAFLGRIKAGKSKRQWPKPSTIDPRISYINELYLNLKKEDVAK